jgi:hypothetical protein
MAHLPVFQKHHHRSHYFMPQHESCRTAMLLRHLSACIEQHLCSEVLCPPRPRTLQEGISGGLASSRSSIIGFADFAKGEGRRHQRWARDSVRCLRCLPFTTWIIPRLVAQKALRPTSLQSPRMRWESPPAPKPNNNSLPLVTFPSIPIRPLRLPGPYQTHNP